MSKDHRLYQSAAHFRHAEENVRCFLFGEYSIDLHVHDFLEINIVFGGKGVHRIGDTEVEVVPGCVFAIPAMVAHGYRNLGGLRVFHLLFRPVFLKTREDARRIEGLEALLEIEPFLREKQAVPLFLILSPKDLMSIQTELLPLLDGGALDYPGADVVREHAALKAVYWMAHLLTLQMQREQAVSNQAILAALAYIHENYQQRISIDDLCARTFMSRSTLHRKFKTVCGCTPNQYLMQYRVKAAIKMMESETNKTTVAHACGFYDLSHMEKCMQMKP